MCFKMILLNYFFPLLICLEIRNKLQSYGFYTEKPNIWCVYNIWNIQLPNAIFYYMDLVKIFISYFMPKFL